MMRHTRLTTGRWRSPAIGFIAAVVVVLAALLATPALAGPDKICPAVAAEGQGLERIDLIVNFRAMPGAAQHARMQALGARTKRAFESIPGLALSLPAPAVARLADDPDVEFVTIDDVVRPNYTEADTSSVLEAMPALPSVPYDGRGVNVAVLDSGYKSHPDLKAVVVTAVSVLPGKTEDLYGHGNHVIGLIAGTGDKYVGFRGVAPGAGIVSVKVLDETGTGRVSDVIAGIDWVLANRASLNIRVANLSLGHPLNEKAAQDPLVQAVERLWDAGVVVVVSAGNDGSKGAGGITSPGNSRKVITVGSYTDFVNAVAADDQISSYSSRGPTLGDHIVKPDLLAPGNRMVSTRASNSYLYSAYPDRRIVPPGMATAEYFMLSGTSMSAAVVSGAAALMLDKTPGLDPATVKARLMRSAKKATLGNPFGSGAGILDIPAALADASWATSAPSPKAYRNATTGMIGFDNTGLTWGNFSLNQAVLWSDAILWSDAVLWSDAILWSDAVLWSDAILWSDAVLWSDAILWSDAVMWSDAVLWADTVVGTGITPDTASVLANGRAEPPGRDRDADSELAGEAALWTD